jgi:iron complex transport system substrate-binding protein
MKHMKILAALSVLFLLVAGLAGCTTTAGTTAAPTTTTAATTTAPTTTAPTTTVTTGTESTAITVIDMTGREITLDAPADRIVALTASDCEILFAVGAGHTLVGRGEYCDYPEQVLDAPSVQSGYNTNIEQIIALDPQVVLMSTMAQSEEQIASLENAGIKVVVSDAQDIEGVYSAMELIGAIVAKDEEAAEVITGMKATFATVAAKSTGAGEQTVYFEVSPLEWGLWTAGKGTFMDELATMLGLTNIFADVEGWGEVSQEQVIERDPDYIVTITMYFGEGPTPVDEIMGRMGWQDMKAIVNDAVLNADSDEISRPGPRLADAINTLYAFVYEN